METMAHTSPLSLDQAHHTLATHGKSFRMASFFLPRAVADDAAVVYRFCRTVDDAVDESVTTAGAMEAVTRLRRELRGIVDVLEERV